MHIRLSEIVQKRILIPLPYYSYIHKHVESFVSACTTQINFQIVCEAHKVGNFVCKINSCMSYKLCYCIPEKCLRFIVPFTPISLIILYPKIP